MNRLLNNNDISALMEKLVPHVEWSIQKYTMLSSEHRIWFWILFALVLLTIIAGMSYLLYRTIRKINDVLQSPEGWRPIRFKYWMWVGSGFYLFFVAYWLRNNGISGWTVSAACGVLVILGFIFYMIRRLKWMRGIGASLVNGGIGLVIAPIVIHSIVLLVLSIVVLFVVWLNSIMNHRRVVYVEYR